MSDILSQEGDASLVGMDVPGQSIEHGGLPGAIGPDYPEDLAGPKLQVIAFHRAQAPEGLREVSRFEEEG
jgi:hypothetical protein